MFLDYTYLASWEPLCFILPSPHTRYTCITAAFSAKALNDTGKPPIVTPVPYLFLKKKNLKLQNEDFKCAKSHPQERKTWEWLE